MEKEITIFYIIDVNTQSVLSEPKASYFIEI